MNERKCAVAEGRCKCGSACVATRKYSTLHNPDWHLCSAVIGIDIWSSQTECSNRRTHALLLFTSLLDSSLSVFSTHILTKSPTCWCYSHFYFHWWHRLPDWTKQNKYANCEIKLYRESVRENEWGGEWRERWSRGRRERSQCLPISTSDSSELRLIPLSSSVYDVMIEKLSSKWRSQNWARKGFVLLLFPFLCFDLFIISSLIIAPNSMLLLFLLFISWSHFFFLYFALLRVLLLQFFCPIELN